MTSSSPLSLNDVARLCWASAVDSQELSGILDRCKQAGYGAESLQILAQSGTDDDWAVFRTYVFPNKPGLALLLRKVTKGTKVDEPRHAEDRPWSDTRNVLGRDPQPQASTTDVLALSLMNK